MQFTPVRRLAAGATATAILAGAFLVPAAIAIADELPDAAPAIASAAVESPEQQDVAPTEEPGAVPSEEPAASEQTTQLEQLSRATQAAQPESPAEEQLVPTASSTDDPQDPTGEIAPGATLEVAYPVASAKMVYAYVIGSGLTATVTNPEGYAFTLNQSGVNHYGEYYRVGMSDGTWTLRITNTGSRPTAPEYDLSYSTSTDTLDVWSSIYQPVLKVSATPVIGGVTRTDLTVLSEAIAPDGTVYSQPMAPVTPGSSQYWANYTGLADGLYFVRMWTVVDGVTYRASRAVGVHVAESDPPAVVVSTSPLTPNAAGWFTGAVTAIITGTDTGSGYYGTTYTLDDGPEQLWGFARTEVAITGDGEHTLRFRGRDNQGNYSDWQESTIRVDATAPTISLHGIVDGARYAVGEELFVEYQCGDATSGLDGENCTADLPDGARVDTTTPGDYTFTIQARDLAGNTTRIVRSYSVGEPDTTDPVVDIELPAEPESGWFTTSVTAHLTATDASGVTRIHWEIDTEEGTLVREVHYHAAYAVIDVTGANTLRYWAEDAAGNRSEEQHVELSLDLVAPEIEVSSPEGAPSILPNGHYAQNERVAVDFDCTDLGSGIASCEGTTPDGELLPTGTTGTHELRIVATDVAGHRTERVVSYIVDPAPAPGSNGGVARPGASDVLASTGAPDAGVAIAISLLLLGGGTALVLRRRTRTR